MNEILKQLSFYLKQSQPLADRYGKKADYDNLTELIDYAAKKELVLLVCGEFKKGKSSFVNALLSQELCPVADGIATSTVSIIRYGEKPKAVRHYSTLDTEMNNGEKLSLKEEEIPIDNIIRFAKGTTDEIDNTMFIDIEVPNAMLKNGLVVIDTPGVGSLDPRHLFLTLQALPKADAFFFVTDTGEPMTTTELDFVKKRLVPAEKPIVVLLNKSEDLDSDERKSHVEDAEKKLFEVCDKKINCIPVSAELWKQFNADNDDLWREKSNRDAVIAALDDFKASREKLLTEKYREQFLVYLEDIRKLITERIESMKNSSNEELLSLQQKLNEIGTFKNMLMNENSEFRSKISSIIKASQEKVMHEFSRESVLLSTEKLEEILNKPEATKKGGEDFVLQQVNQSIQKLAGEVDNKINQAIKDVMKELQNYVEEASLAHEEFEGDIHVDFMVVKHSFSEKFANGIRQALPFLGVSTLFGLVGGWAIGVAAGVFYVVQSIFGTKKAERAANIRKQIAPRISIVVNEMRAHIQKSYAALQEEVIKSLRSVAENMTQQMQGTMRMIQECQQGDQQKAAKIKELQEHLTMSNNLLTQAKVYGHKLS